MFAPTTKAMITPDTYHDDTTRISKSGLDLIREAPALYYERYFGPIPTGREAAHFQVGRAFHRAVTEPQTFNDKYILAPTGIRRNTIDGRERWARFLELSGDKFILKSGETDGRDLSYEQIVGMAASARKHPRVGELLKAGTAERVITWEDPDTGAPCKAMIDWISDKGPVVDLKSTKAASPAKFRRSIIDYRYHVQAAFYLDGLRANGIDTRGFIFLAVEKRRPYIAEAYYLDPDFLAAGRAQYKEDLATYMECRRTKNWYGYTGPKRPITVINYQYQ